MNTNQNQAPPHLPPLNTAPLAKVAPQPVHAKPGSQNNQINIQAHPHANSAQILGRAPAPIPFEQVRGRQNNFAVTNFCCATTRGMSSLDFLETFFKHQFVLVTILLSLEVLEGIIMVGAHMEFRDNEKSEKKAFKLMKITKLVATLLVILWFIDAWVFYCKVKKGCFRN